MTAPPHQSFERLNGWLKHPLGKLCLSLICPAMVAFATTVGWDTYKRYFDEKKEIAETFINQADLYENISYRMLWPLLTQTGPIDAPAREALIENLDSQSKALYAASRLLKPNKVILADTYRQELLVMRSIISKLQPDKVTAFYDASKPLLEDRDRLIHALEPSKLPADANNPSTPVPVDARTLRP